MIKHIFCDLDGTIFFDGEARDADIQAVQDFVAGGGQFHVATGRSDAEITTFSKQFAIPVTHRVSGNGSTVYTVDNECLATNNIDAEVLAFTAQTLLDNIDRVVDFELQIDDQVHFHQEPTEFARTLKDGILVVDPDLLEKVGKTVVGAKYYVQGDEALMVQLAADLKEKFPEQVAVFDDGSFLNVNPKGIHKGVAINLLLDKYNIDPTTIAVIGDGANDIDMFAVTDNSFSFTHAKPAVQEYAVHTVDSVADAIEVIAEMNNETE